MRRVSVHLDGEWRAVADPAWLVGWDPQPFELAGGTTEVVVMGAGPPLLLLPPLPGWKEAWAACAVLLARRFRVVTFDLRARYAPEDRWAQCIDDTLHVADALAPGRFVLVGHSLGGALAQRVALAHPQRVAAVVLSSTFARIASPPGTSTKRLVEQPFVLATQRLLPDPLAAPLARHLAESGAWVYDPACGERVLAFVRYAIRRAPTRDVAVMVRLALGHDTRTLLPSLAAPTLVLHGGRESGFVREAAAEMVRLLPHAECAVLPGVGHLHLLSAPDVLAGTIERWLDRAAPDGRLPARGGA